MKRILLFVIAIMLFAFPAAAENIDISELSTEELLELGEMLDAAFRECDDWQKVRVPTGIYQVGVDIPAGTWTIICEDDKELTLVTVAKRLNDSATNVFYTGDNDTGTHGLIYYTDHGKNCKTQWTVTLHDGEYVQVSRVATFITYTNKAPFTFIY